MTKIWPATDFLATDDIFDEEYSTIEPQRQFVEQLDVLKQVVIWVTTIHKIEK